MKVIVGLGNPGPEYEDTWHNLGFVVIDRLSLRAGVKRFRDESEAKIAETAIGGERVLLAKPQTFMNLSGNAVRPLLLKYGDGDLAGLIVVFDDVALPFGLIRVRASGSSGGQKGMKSLIERLGGDEFARVRIGIRPDHPIADLSGYVLSKAPKRNRQELDEVLDRAADAVEVILIEGIESAMQKFNQRVKDEVEDAH